MSDHVLLKDLPNGVARLLCYPKFSNQELERRLAELKKLGVESLELQGCSQVECLRVLGKGYSSIVITAVNKSGRLYALKVRRLDSGKPDMSHEALMQRSANRLGVGVKLHGATTNFILMDLVQGSRLAYWIAELKPEARKARLRKVLSEVLRHCRILDRAGLDHGELSWAYKHILVDDKDRPFLIDFEKASLGRRPANVTSTCQYLFIGGKAAERILRILGGVDKVGLVEELRTYKHKPCETNFQRLLAVLKLL